MKYYLAGPMSGIEGFNFSMFERAADFLRNVDYEIVSPTETEGNDPNDPIVTWASCMRRNIPRLVECDGIFLLPGWEEPRGATFEAMIAYLLHFQCLILKEDSYGIFGLRQTEWPVAQMVAGFFNTNLRKSMDSLRK